MMPTTAPALRGMRLVFFSALVLASWFSVAVAAEADTTKPIEIYTDTAGGYKYLGCFNETMGIALTDGSRSLSNGKNEVKIGGMTVQVCQQFCKEGEKPFKYAGLEFASECWCAQTLNPIADQFADSACDLPCDGNKTQACGGSLKLTVYMISGASSVQIGGVMWVAALFGTAVTFIPMLLDMI
ncbi:WSC domain-containing protein [Apodospora peruviana]|uniref:WSC domain-containing protein n=1 Tax=Apodospora peruviana TaxID=516989 RepID=A0AAE0IR08_9PEZI|nr:WSC domain-containing protein [Apodospora peruviana]